MKHTSLQLVMVGGLGITLLLFLISNSGAGAGALSDTFVSAERLPNAAATFVQAEARATVLPLRDWSIEDPDISAESALVIDDVAGEARPLFARAMRQRRPVASIIKLLTALTVRAHIAPEKQITVTREDIAAPEAAGGLRVGETLDAETLLAAMLIESSNDAAHALARTVGQESISNFVTMMNEQARSLGLPNTRAADPMGINPATTATAVDVARLLQHALRDPVIRPLLAQRRFVRGSHVFTSTHGLNGQLDGIVGAKTGFTDEAGENLVLQRHLARNHRITTVVLGSSNRERDTLQLHRWTEEAFHYE